MKPTIRGIVASDIDPDKVIGLERTIAGASDAGS